MSRLPRRLQPAWPLVKRVHKSASLGLGYLNRPLSRTLGQRALPHIGTQTSAATAAREPESVRLHPASAAQLLQRDWPAGVPARHWGFADDRTVEIAPTYVLDINDGRLVGDFAATLTPGGVLDYATSGYFGVASWAAHPIFLRPWLPPETHLAGTAVALHTRGASNNYYHFLHDVLPRWGILRQAFPDLVPDHVIAPHQTGFQKQLLALTGLDELPLQQPSSSTTLRADRLLVPATPNNHLMAPPTTLQWLRENLPATGPGMGPRLYITRGTTPHTRCLVHELHLRTELEKRGFVILDPGQHSVQEQIDAFAAAEVVVGPHGAALSNLAFSRPGTKVLELFAPNYVNTCYWTIADAIGCDYRYLVAQPDSVRPGSPKTGVLTDIELTPAEVLGELEVLLGC